jgi:hypothetical protein
MTTTLPVRCDGCGQPASPEHIAKRLARLEWTTRYRPVHIGTLLLGAAAPRDDSAFLYAQTGNFAREAEVLLSAAGVSAAEKPAEVVLAEFQRAGFLLTYVMDCAVEPGSAADTDTLLADQLPAVVTRIRRSLKPKTLVLISTVLAPVIGALRGVDLGCSLLLDDGKPFALDGDAPAPDLAATRLRQALTAGGIPVR